MTNSERLLVDHHEGWVLVDGDGHALCLTPDDALNLSDDLHDTAVRAIGQAKMTAFVSPQRQG